MRCEKKYLYKWHALENEDSQRVLGIARWWNRCIWMEVVPRSEDIVNAGIEVQESVLGDEEGLVAMNQTEEKPYADREWPLHIKRKH
jgi:hypothetical protein